MRCASCGYALPAKILNFSSIKSVPPNCEFAGRNRMLREGLFVGARSNSGRSAPRRAPQSSGTSPARKRIAEEDLVFRKQPGGSARLRWVSVYSKHRRTATRQRGFRSSSLEQVPADTSKPGVPPENYRLEIVRETAFPGAPAQSAETP